MRLRLPIRRAVLFGLMLVVALLLTLPLRIVLGAADPGVTAREVSGSLWAGRLAEARAGPALLGDLDARVAPLPLLAARARIAVARAGSGPPLTGALSLGGATRKLDGLTGSVPLSGPVPLGAVTFVDLDVTFRDGRCQSASGQVRADVAPGAGGGAPLAQGLAGSPRCDRGALLVPLASASGAQGLDLRLAADGSWQADLRLDGVR
jgi:general secretion pathway protein N